MRIIKLGLISLVFFVIFLTLLSFLFPSRVRISKAIDIRTSKDSLVAQLKNPLSWRKWYPGADTAVLITNGIKTHEGKELTVVGITDSSIVTMSKGGGTKETKGGWNIFPGGTPDTYTVQWYMDIYLRWYPWEKFSGLLLEKRYGPVMEKGLDNLKALLEK